MAVAYAGLARNPEGQVLCVLVTANSEEAARAQIEKITKPIAHEITRIETIVKVMDFRKEPDTFAPPLPGRSL